ncbi:TadE/TadG family type IV pilus assembly protein [Oceanibium sediminis]|uniref:TadE/TadG family type IV pilus assembly protein n=1 Tax=Oceanibium sediminis TaxID=2026339 RepID=UPI000DD4D0DB|nr:TadE family protein [Oceanibium sediminis]
MTLCVDRILTEQCRRARRFFNVDEDGGTTTIEFVLWLPIFILVLGIIIDVCFMFLAQAIMYDVASDAARSAAIGQFETEQEAIDFAQDKASFRGVLPSVTVDLGATSGTVEVTITHQAQDIDLTGVLGIVAGDTIRASVTQIREGS